MGKRVIRTGIDVGGTHTRAIAIGNSINRTVGKESVMTTHFTKEGTVKGVVGSFQKCLEENSIQPDEVAFIAHSAAQAINALLKGDVAKVGTISIGKGGLESFLTKRQAKIPDIDLGIGRFIHIDSHFTKVEDMSENSVRVLIQDMYNQGDRVIVAPEASGVDNTSEGRLMSETADKVRPPSSMASDIIKLYGLTIRTRTAALNASILPKMMETASGTRSLVCSTGADMPLMIIRGGGGVMEVNEMKERSVLTMSSDPAASVIGALMYLRASNSIYFEVGDTFTNIDVIKNGRPVVDYAIIGGRRTYVSSPGVRMLDVTEGSMARAGKNDITDVGPRSAHIANMGYVCFTDPSLLEGTALYHAQPRESDPDDYVAIRLNNGESVIIANICAANVLGIPAEEDHVCSNKGSARMAIKLLVGEVEMSVEDITRTILQKSTDEIKPVIEDLTTKCKIKRDQIVLVGAEDGASTLLTFTANGIDSKHQTPENAGVTSFIGVALAMVREMVERTLPDPSAQDIAQLKKETKGVTMNSSAVEGSIEVYVEIDEQVQKMTAIAMGSTEVKTIDLMKNCDRKETVSIVAAFMGMAEDRVNLEATSGQIFAAICRQGNKNQLQVIDEKGLIKIQRSDGSYLTTTMKKSGGNLKKIWDTSSSFSSEVHISSDVYVICGSRVIDYSGVPEYKQVAGLIEAEPSDRTPSDEVVLALAKSALG